jgi:hypothetical protein
MTNRKPRYRIKAATLHDTNTVSPTPDGLVVITTAGDVVITNEEGSDLTLKSVQLNTVLPFGYTRIKNTGTTAVGVCYLYLDHT